MAPAHQCLRRHRLGRAGIHDRLVVDLELLPLERPAQRVLQGQPLERGGVHRARVGLVAVPALLLRLVHRGVGVHQERVEILPVERVDRDPDARVHEDLVPVHPDRMRQPGENPASQLGRVLRVGKAGHDDGELVAAEPGDVRVERLRGRADLVLPLAAGGAQARGDMLEQLVAGLVAEGVVDPAEVIEVDEERRHQPIVAVGVLQGLGQPLLVGEAIGQAGETVVVGQRAHLLQHPRIGQRDRGLIGQPPHLHPVVRMRRCIPAVAQGDDADQLALKAERQHEQTARAAVHQRGEVGGYRPRLVGVVDDRFGSIEQVLHIRGPEIHPNLLASPVSVVVHQAGQRLGAIGRHERHAHHRAGVDVAHPGQQRGDDVARVGRREHRAIDLGRGRESLELPVELARHRVEGGAQLLELVPASDRDPTAEIAMRDPLGAFLKLVQREQAAPDLAHAEQENRGPGQHARPEGRSG